MTDDLRESEIGRLNQAISAIQADPSLSAAEKKGKIDAARGQIAGLYTPVLGKKRIAKLREQMGLGPEPTAQTGTVPAQPATSTQATVPATGTEAPTLPGVTAELKAPPVELPAKGETKVSLAPPTISDTLAAAGGNIKGKLTPLGDPYQYNGKWFQPMLAPDGKISAQPMPEGFAGTPQKTGNAIWLEDKDGNKKPFMFEGGKFVPVEAPEGFAPPSKEAVGKQPKVDTAGGILKIEDPLTNKVYTAKNQIPADRKDLMTLWDSTAKQIADRDQKAADLETKKFNERLIAQDHAIQNALKASDYKTAKKEVQKADADYQGAIDRMKTMDANYSDIVKTGDQQAMLSLVANHIGMTLGAQKGARITRAVWEEAVESAPWLSRVGAKFSDDGLLSGVVITSEQAYQMVKLGHEKVEVLKDHVARVKEEYADDLGAREQPSTPGNLRAKSRKLSRIHVRVEGKDYWMTQDKIDAARRDGHQVEVLAR